jgi:integrase
MRVGGAHIELPALPSLIRYRDPFLSVWKTIESPATNDTWIVETNGRKGLFEFPRFPESVRLMMRHVICDSLLRYAASSVFEPFKDLVWLINKFGPEVVLLPMKLEPLELRRFWNERILPALIEGRRKARSPKLYLKFLCKNSLGRLRPGDEKFVSRLEGPKADLYASVRSNDVFLSNAEQLSIIQHLDDLSETAAKTVIDTERLRDACLLIATFQYAMRPIQLAKLKQADVIVRNDIATDGPIVHVRFSREKQKDPKKRIPLLRKIKHEWSVLYVQYLSAILGTPTEREGAPLPRQSLFKLTPVEVSTTIKSVLLAILGRSRTATDLRHTAAQRMVDRGASIEEVAEFLGQSNLRTCLIYFGESATQAGRLNKAISSSHIYSEIQIVHLNKMIDVRRLKAMSGDLQIGAVAHGIPIAGIGACEVGQSICTKSPVLSCYGAENSCPSVT